MQPFSIYLASHYERLEELVTYRRVLEENNYLVTSSWLNGEHDANKWLGGEYAIEDLRDIDRSHVLVAFTDREPHARGGLHTEIGYALALDARRVFLVGPRTNVFHQMLGDDRVFDDFVRCAAELSYIRVQWIAQGRMFPVLRPSNPISMYDIWSDTYLEQKTNSLGRRRNDRYSDPTERRQASNIDSINDGGND